MHGVDVKNKVLIGTLVLVFLLAILVMLCGIGLSLGFRTVSVVSFFGVIGLLAVLRLVGWSVKSGRDRKD